MASHIHLVASPDDFLLEGKVAAILTPLSAELGVEAEVLSDDITPDELAVELCSPSLFSPQRLLVVSEVREWIGAPPPRGMTKKEKADGDEDEDDLPDVKALVQVIEEGFADGIALVMRSWCGRQAKGELVDAITAAGSVHWVPLPPSPKPWEDVAVSKEQAEILRGVMTKAADGIRFSPAAERLLMDRLGFAPRLLAQEVRKLAAAGSGGEVDEKLVRALSFPKERSLEVVRDAVLERRAAPVLDLIGAAEGGISVRDWGGKILRPDALPFVLVSMVSSILQQMLYLRRLAADQGLEREMAPSKTADSRWYGGRFKNGLGPDLLRHLEADAPSPLVRAGAKKPTVWSLGNLFRGASLYTDDELMKALASFGGVEVALRGGLRIEAASVWLAGILSRP